jgi:dihydrofolate synthase/folylpolyglutamate synthase
MKSINEYFDFLYSLERTGMKYDLTNITTLCRHLGNPQNSFKSIHIAGTNGKGATSSFIASILMEHGFEVGLFTSPHILEFNERIRINGKPIPTKYVREFLDNNIRIIKRIKPSFFEVNTAMAFKYFADKKVEVAVIECGLGGRLDSTNILNPEVSVITPIGMDHMQFLGNTLKQIAREKLGIVKPGIKVVVSDRNPLLKPLFRKSIGSDNLLYLKDEVKIYPSKQTGTGLSFSITQAGKTIPLATPLPGMYQSINASAAFLAVTEFLRKQKKKFSIAALKKGLKKVKTNSGYFGRLEIMKVNGRQYIFDVSHNPAGIKETFSSLEKLAIKPDMIIFGIMSDKDYIPALKEVLKHSKFFIFTKPDYSRALDPNVLIENARTIEPKKLYLTAKNAKGILELLKVFRPKSPLVIGSFFLVSDILKSLGHKKLPV